MPTATHLIILEDLTVLHTADRDIVDVALEEDGVMVIDLARVKIYDGDGDWSDIQRAERGDFLTEDDGE